MSRVYAASEARDLRPTEFQQRERHTTALLIDPAHFDVKYEINPLMGGEIDHGLAREQWETLRDAYERYADRVAVLDPDAIWETHFANGDGDRPGGDEPAEGEWTDTVPPSELPDIVFCANQSLPFPGEDRAVLGRMASAERAPEVAYLQTWYAANGYETEPLAIDCEFEGMGDALWHPGRELLLGGYGFRTERDAYPALADQIDVPVVTFELTVAEGYHLDVVLSVLDEDHALVYPDGFTDDGLAALESLFETVIEVPRAEAWEGLACNAHCLDGEHVLLQSGNETTTARLEDYGFEPVPIETSEFMKAGGSIFCLKLML